MCFLGCILWINFRFLYSLSYGFVAPLAFSLLAENLPVKSRGIALSLVGVNYALGEVLACAMAYLLLNDLEVKINIIFW